ncbi:hypothetical protein C0J52_10164 [Blattella germanica]|nr:hypothetical protein C0J52_10164 [Blattella germanica]
MEIMSNLLQLGKVETIPASVLYDKWNGICLNEDALTDMLKLGEFEEDVNWMKFIAIASGHLAKSLTQTMYLICELLTEEPEGGSDMISLETFTDLYTYLARMDCGPEEEADGKSPEEGTEEAKEETPAEEEEQTNEAEEESANSASQIEEENKEPKKEILGIGPIIPDEQINSVIEYLKFWAERQEGMVMPRNIHHFLCPSLDKIPVSD